MNKINAAREAIDKVGANALTEKLADLTGEPVTIHAVRKWRRCGVPGKWVPAVCAITGASETDLNPIAATVAQNLQTA